MTDLDVNSFVPGEAVVHLKAGDLVRQLPVYGAAPLKSNEPPPTRVGLDDFDAALKPFGVRALFRVFDAPEFPQLAGIVVVRFDERNKVEMVLAALNELPSVIESSMHACLTACVVPDDLRYGDQWGLPEINCPQAWGVTTGDPAVVIAVIDTGCDFNHRDIADHLLPGRNFITPGQSPQDDDGHGTEMAGVIGALTNNTYAVAGVMWACKLLPVKAVPAGGSVAASTYAQGIVWAAQSPQSAAIINCSYAARAEDVSLKNAVVTAGTAGALVVTASADLPSGVSAYTPYPGKYAETMDHVVCVGATDSNNKRSTYSNYGSWLTLVAPGDGIWTLHLGDGGSTEVSGTSLSTAFVSGVAGLIRAARPTATAFDIKRQLLAGARPLGGPIPNQNYGYGLVDAWGCLPQLKFAFQASNSPTMFVASSSDGKIFRQDRYSAHQVGQCTAFAQFGDNLYVAFQAADGTNNLVVAYTTDGKSYVQPLAIPTAKLGNCVAMASFNEKLYLATPSIVASENRSLVVFTSSDGEQYQGIVRPNFNLGNCAAMATLNNTLYLVYQANDSSKKMYLTSSSDGNTWQPARSSGNIQLGSCVAITGFNQKLYVAAQDSSGHLAILSSSDFSTFQPVTGGPSSIPMGNTVAAAVFNHNLYVAYKNLNGDLLVVYSPNGDNWSPVMEFSSIQLGNSAAMAVFRSPYLAQLKLIFQASIGDDMVLASSRDGETFTQAQHPEIQIGQTVGVAQFNDSLYMAFQTPNSTDMYVASAADGLNFGQQTRIPTGQLGSGAAMAVFKNRLYLAAPSVAAGHNRNLIVAASGDGAQWSTTEVTTIQLGSNAAMVPFINDKLYLAYQNNSNQNLMVASSSDGSTWSANEIRIPVDRCIAMAVFNSVLYVAARDSNLNLNIASSRDGITFTGVYQTQNAGNSLAMAVFDGKLHIAFQHNVTHNLQIVYTVDSTHWFGPVEHRDIQLGDCAAMAIFEDPARAPTPRDLVSAAQAGLG
ncbi:S8 family serine peptidase [Mycobacterium sp. 050128]|uniref:S8 family peptidase n=1 Tax=Mycobacterium sp. 050128 TaxID=3096112 RepID=UPI002ED86E6D